MSDIIKYSLVAFTAFVIIRMLNTGLTLISQPSDTSVLVGFILIVLSLGGTVGSILFFFPGVQRWFSK